MSLDLDKEVESALNADDALAFNSANGGSNEEMLIAANASSIREDIQKSDFAEIIQWPNEVNSAKITNIKSLSKAIEQLYKPLINSRSGLSTGFIRSCTSFERFAPSIVNGTVQWDRIHNKAIAIIPSFDALIDWYNFRKTPNSKRSKNWAFRILLSGNTDKIHALIKKNLESLKLLKYLKKFKNLKIFTSYAFGQLRQSIDGNDNIYNGVFIGFGLARGYSFRDLPTIGDFYSDWFEFKTSTELSIQDFHGVFSRLTVVAGVISCGYSVSYFSFHDEDAIGKEAVSMNVSGGVDGLISFELGTYAGWWFNLPF